MRTSFPLYAEGLLFALPLVECNIAVPSVRGGITGAEQYEV